MTKREHTKRCILFIISLFFLGIGVALTKHGNLGVSPISSVANVVSCRFEFLSFGTWLIISNSLLVVAQMFMLGKKFHPIQLLQFPMLFIFGYFTDLGGLLIGGLPNESYPLQLTWVICGIIVHGFGITLGVIADVFLNAGEAFVKTLADCTKKDFATVKVLVDVVYVLCSAVLSLLFFKGTFIGIREGTVLSALGVGLVVKFFRYLLKKPITNILKK